MTGQGRGPSDSATGFAGNRRGFLARLRARTAGRTAAHFAVPLADIAGFETPPCADWLWRPDLWAAPCLPAPVSLEGSGQRIQPGAALFHDSTAPEVRLRQRASPEAAAPWALELDVGVFDGSFMSLALDLPAAGVAGISRRHLVGASFRFRQPAPPKVFARFNLRHGPNTETLLRELPSEPDDAGRVTVEFDLAYIEMNERRVTAAWIDVIFQDPAGHRIGVDDLVLYRRPRAEL